MGKGKEEAAIKADKPAKAADNNKPKDAKPKTDGPKKSDGAPKASTSNAAATTAAATPAPKPKQVAAAAAAATAAAFPPMQKQEKPKDAAVKPKDGEAKKVKDPSKPKEGKAEKTKDGKADKAKDGASNNSNSKPEKAKAQLIAQPSKFEKRKQDTCDKIQKVMAAAVGEERIVQIDRPIITYILDVIEAQTHSNTRIEQSEVITLLALFLYETGMITTRDEATLLTETIIQTLKQDKILSEATHTEETVTKLKEAVSLNKVYEDHERQMQHLLGQTSIDVNTNDEIDWEEAASREKQMRKKRKEDKSRQAERQAYDDFLKSRGLSKVKGIVKVHNAEAVTGSRDIKLENFSISMGKHELCKDASLTLSYGRRYGLVGRNGVGKTTFLRHLAERELEGIPAYMQILHIEQEVAGDSTSALQTVLSSDVEREQLLAEEQQLLNSKDENSAARLNDVYRRMEDIDAHSAEAKAASILSGLGFTAEMTDSPTKTLSGGWRMRVALARALFIEPEVLMLDEPTNHLDLHAVLWLENYLMKWSKTLIIVSHARNFLNVVATDIVHFNDQKLITFRGNYDAFERTRVEQLKNQQRAHEAQQARRKHLQSFVDRFRYKAATAAMAQSRLKMLEKMEFIAAVVEDPTFSFRFPDPDPVSPPYVQAIDVSFGFAADRTLFRGVNFNLDMDSRIALVGDNGAGKSTFLNVLLGDLNPEAGIVNRNGKLRIARFSQHHVDQLSLQQTPVEYMQARFPGSDAQAVRAHLGGFGLTGELAVQPIYTLSGGQKSRVVFSLLTFQRPHIMLLDEPTNHLDLDTVDALIQALNVYGGGVLIVSHDQHLISSVCDEIWVCGGGEMRKWDGDFEDYKKSLRLRL